MRAGRVQKGSVGLGATFYFTVPRTTEHIK